MAQERNLEQELKDLNIINMDSVGFLTKDDIFTSLDAIKNHQSTHTNEFFHSQIEIRQEEKRKRMGELRSI